MQKRHLRIASAAYPIDRFIEWSQYEKKLVRWVNEAVAAQANLLVFPEYAAMELASLFAENIYRSLPLQLQALQKLLPDYLALHQRLASENNIYILAGSIPVLVDENRYHNRAYFFSPHGYYDFQDKLQMTRFEKEQWLISPSETLKVFHTELGSVGVNICYDSEFPLFAHRQVAAGADIILVISCTDTLAGYERVRLGSRARALENQCFVIHSATVGEAPWSPAVDVNIGTAAVYTPLDYGFPDDGILQQGTLNQAGWIYQPLDLSSLVEVRESGQVLNYRDWPGQDGVCLQVVNIK